MPTQSAACAIKSAASCNDDIARTCYAPIASPITFRDVPRRHYSPMDAHCARRLTDFCPGVSTKHRLHCQRRAQDQSRNNGQSHIFSSTLTVVHDAPDM